MSWTNPHNELETIIARAFQGEKEITLIEAKTSIAKPLRTKKRKKWRKIEIFVVKQLKSGEKRIYIRKRKILRDLPNLNRYRRKKRRIFVPKSYRKLLRAYFG